MRYFCFRLRLQMRLGLYWQSTHAPSPQPELLRDERRGEGCVSFDDGG